MEWWTYVLIAILLFLMCLLLHFAVRKINEARLEERFIRLYGKTSSSTSVQGSLFKTDNQKQLSKSNRFFNRKGTNPPTGISLVFSKEDNKRRKHISEWKFEGSWSKLLPKAITLTKLNINESNARSEGSSKPRRHENFIVGKSETPAVAVHGSLPIPDTTSLVKRSKREYLQEVMSETDLIASAQRNHSDSSVYDSREGNEGYNKFLGAIYCKMNIGTDNNKIPYQKSNPEARCKLDLKLVIEESCSLSNDMQSMYSFDSHSDDRNLVDIVPNNLRRNHIESILDTAPGTLNNVTKIVHINESLGKLGGVKNTDYHDTSESDNNKRFTDKGNLSQKFSYTDVTRVLKKRPVNFRETLELKLGHKEVEVSAEGLELMDRVKSSLAFFKQIIDMSLTSIWDSNTRLPQTQSLTIEENMEPCEYDVGPSFVVTNVINEDNYKQVDEDKMANNDKTENT